MVDTSPETWFTVGMTKTEFTASERKALAVLLDTHENDGFGRINSTERTGVRIQACRTLADLGLCRVHIDRVEHTNAFTARSVRDIPVWTVFSTPEGLDTARALR